MYIPFSFSERPCKDLHGALNIKYDGQNFGKSVFYQKKCESGYISFADSRLTYSFKDDRIDQIKPTYKCQDNFYFDGVAESCFSKCFLNVFSHKGDNELVLLFLSIH